MINLSNSLLYPPNFISAGKGDGWGGWLFVGVGRHSGRKSVENHRISTCCCVPGSHPCEIELAIETSGSADTLVSLPLLLVRSAGGLERCVLCGYFFFGATATAAASGRRLYGSSWQSANGAAFRGLSVVCILRVVGTFRHAAVVSVIGMEGRWVGVSRHFSAASRWLI